LNLCERVSTGGEIAIYVYKRKAALREYAILRPIDIRVTIRRSSEGHERPDRVGRASCLNWTSEFVCPLVVDQAGDAMCACVPLLPQVLLNPSMSFADNMAVNYD
jgi:hypothetical protein